MTKLTIKDGYIGRGGTAIRCDNPNAEISVENVTFDNNERDIHAPDGLKELHVKGSKFVTDDPTEAKPSTKYFGGIDVDKDGKIIR